MSTAKKIYIGLLLFIVLVIGFAIWYKATYSMSVIEDRYITHPNATSRVLIASQGSAFKEKVVDGVLDMLKKHPIEVQLTDVTRLDQYNADEWDAIVILHTWEVWQPQEDAAAFLESHYDPRRVFVLSTSGESDEKIPGIDAITCASVMHQTGEMTTVLNSRLANALRL